MLGTRISVLKGFGFILERLDRVSFLRWLLELDDIVGGNGDFEPFTPANLYYTIAQNDEISKKYAIRWFIGLDEYNIPPITKTCDITIISIDTLLKASIP